MKMKKITIIAALFLVLAAFAPETGYQPGDKIKDFTLKNIDEKLISLADYKDAKGFIVVFTCNHCPYAVKYEDRIIALNDKCSKLGYPVIAINPNDPAQYPDDDFKSMQKRAKDKKFTFPYLIDETQIIAQTFGAKKTPHIFLIQKEKTDLVVKYIGAIDDNADNATAVTQRYVENAVDSLIAGNPVKPEVTKAIGCGIKWKK